VKSLRAFVLIALTTMCLVAGCASATTQGRSGRGNSAQLTQSEMAASNADNLYDVIAKLRPECYRARAGVGPNSTPTSVDIYMNGTMLGKAEILRDVRLQDVTDVRYWDVGQASARFGMGHPRGVIEITRK